MFLLDIVPYIVVKKLFVNKGISTKKNKKIEDHDLSIRIGLIIDHKLNWCEHIAYVKNKVSKGYCLRQDNSWIRKAYIIFTILTYIIRNLIYGIEVCGSTCQTHIHPLCLVYTKL